MLRLFFLVSSPHRKRLKSRLCRDVVARRVEEGETTTCTCTANDSLPFFSFYPWPVKWKGKGIKNEPALSHLYAGHLMWHRQRCAHSIQTDERIDVSMMGYFWTSRSCNRQCVGAREDATTIKWKERQDKCRGAGHRFIFFFLPQLVCNIDRCVCPCMPCCCAHLIGHTPEIKIMFEIIIL